MGGYGRIGVYRVKTELGTHPWKLLHSGCLLPGPCSRAVHRRNVNNKEFGVCFHYIKLNPIIIGSDLVVLD